MKEIIAPIEYISLQNEVTLFLAGGITNCPEWQKDIIKRLNDLSSDKLVVYNPRRDNFPINDSSASYGQIQWEFDKLNKVDIFSMYFTSGISDQPICMYELGRYISIMQQRFPIDWENRIIISVEDGYKRKQDVIIQTELACGNKIHVNSQVNDDVLKTYHAEYIIKAYKQLVI